MSIEYRKGDLLEQEDIKVISHVANLHGVMGGGVALAIKDKYPEAYVADCKTPLGDSNKLGTYSHAKTWDGKIIINVYAMFGLGGDKRQTSYDAFTTAFENVEKVLRAQYEKTGQEQILGVPYLIGCGLAGGNYIIVEAILKSIFEKSPVTLVICEL